jgi:hypothetical protein
LSEKINDKNFLPKGDDDVSDEIGILISLLNESLTMKKFNLVGCKMKIYQERMRQMSFLEMITTFKKDDHIDID